ncbi:MAG: bifunctional hydroxymethylpyrimidine kinase/phosphomethylpyrimidine kinase [Alistipes sp.]|nr:bifunctional hydroxymethylpyrimidine kinase/phosphomethylpyrimidine kinase [Alistipes sp.]MBR6720620.1 bifunctional hydroxymethylpyrimidine kinase/phosphomethylpyrimidine kinase [Alistipes sp.]
MSIKVNNDKGDKYLHATHSRTLRYPVVLSIAGSDSSGGAGIQADLKTLSSLGVYGATAITAITAQNTEGVHSQLAIPAQMVYDQIVAVIEDIHPAVIKIGMLSNVEVANVVADALTRYALPIILDPVMVSSSGHRLLSIEAQQVVKQRLLPMATLITPNIPEMEALTEMPLSTLNQKHAAASYLIALGAQAILLKGGHEEGATKRDILYRNTGAGVDISYHSTPTVVTKNIHGTGCSLSSAIAAYVARGLGLTEAVDAAKSYIFEAIKAGADVSIGRGFGAVNHLFNPQKMEPYEE